MLLQNAPNSRQSPVKEKNIFEVYQKLPSQSKTILSIVFMLLFFLGVYTFFLLKGVATGFYKASTLTEITAILPIIIFVLLAVYIVYTLRQEINRPVKEQLKYYELGKLQPLAEKQQKALRLVLVSTYYDGFWIKTLEYYPCEVRVNTNEFKPKSFFIASKENYKQQINDDWGIVSKAQYKQWVEELFSGLHSKQFAVDMEYATNADAYINRYSGEEEKLNIKKQNENFISRLAGLIEKPEAYVLDCNTELNGKLKKLVWAFDLGRVIPMAQNAFMAGLITEDEAWHDILKAAGLSYFLFNSYEDFFDNYRLGHAYWSDNLEQTRSRLDMWKLYVEKCDWPEKHLDWSSDLIPAIPDEMKTGFRNYIASKLKKEREEIGFRRNDIR